jgi:hypothetical protein
MEGSGSARLREIEGPQRANRPHVQRVSPQQLSSPPQIPFKLAQESLV